MKQFMLFISAVMVLFLAPIYAKNPDIDDNGLQKREQNAMQSYSEVNNLSESYGRFLVVRDKNLHGENGIQDKYRKCYTNLGQWLNDWGVLFSTLDLKDKVDSNTMQSQVQNMLSRQASNGEEIKLTCNSIKSDVDAALLIINNAPNYDANILSNYKNILDQAENMKARLIQILNNYAASPMTRMAKLDNLIELSRKASLAKLRIELLNNAKIPLEKTLDEFRSILLASKISDAALSNIMRNENKINEYALNFQYFGAKKLIGDIRTDCKNKLDNMNSSGLDKKYLNSSIDRLNTLCKASEEHFSVFNSLGASHSEYVFHYFQLVSSNIKLDCKNNDTKNTIACNKMAVLSSINLDNLKDLADPKLEYMEGQLEKIYEEYKK
jgi:hypothetical protein